VTTNTKYPKPGNHLNVLSSLSHESFENDFSCDEFSAQTVKVNLLILYRVKRNFQTLNTSENL